MDGSLLTFNSGGNKSLYFHINNPGGDSFVLNYTYGTFKGRVVLNQDNAWTYSNSINLTGNGVFSVSVTDGNLLEQTLTI
jgi:hypothetical protein